jgi:hypothetical protein
MKAVLALIFFACIAGSMAADARLQAVNQLLQQGQAVVQTVVGQLQQQVLGLVQQALGQLQSLVGSLGGRVDIFGDLLSTAQAALAQAAQGLLGQLAGALSGLLGGRALGNLAAIFQNFLQEVQGTVTSLGQHVLNQGLSAVLGGLGSLGGSRAFGDIFSSLSQQIAAAVSAAQGAAQGALGSLQALGANLVDASKPHWEQLQEQLVGHGLNVLGSLSETINNLHGSITGGR